jgi:hypothetical protein
LHHLPLGHFDYFSAMAEALPVIKNCPEFKRVLSNSQKPKIAIPPPKTQANSLGAP